MQITICIYGFAQMCRQNLPNVPAHLGKRDDTFVFLGKAGFFQLDIKFAQI